MTLLTIRLILAILSMLHQRSKRQENELGNFNIICNKECVVRTEIALLMICAYYLLLGGLIVLSFLFYIL